MRLKLGLALSALVPVLGLFSCSKDSPTNDGWRLSEPMVSSAELGSSDPVREAPIQNLPGDAVLKFKADDIDSSQVLVTATCQSRLGLRKSRASFTRRSDFQIRSLWPRELWLTLNNEELVQSSCNFTFAITHENVVHDFTLENVKVQTFTDSQVSAATLNAKRNGAPSNSDIETLPQALLAKLPVTKESDASTEFHFLCETYSRNASVSDLNDAIHVGQSFEQLFAGTAWPNLDVIDPRHERPTQNCRFLKTNSEDNLLYELTPTFVYRFAPPKLRISSANDFSVANRDNYRNLKVFEVNVKNENDTPTAIGVPSSFGNIRLRLVGKHAINAPNLPFPMGSFILGSRIMSEPVSATVSKSPAAQDGGLNIYELLPGEEIRISGNLNSGANCYADVSLDPNTFLQSRNMGLMYGYEQVLTIVQFQDWDPHAPASRGPAEVIASESIFPHVDSSGIPRVFAASQSFLNTIGASDRLPGIIAEYPGDFEYVFNKKSQRDPDPVNNCFFNRMTWRQLGPFGTRFDKQLD